VGSVMACKCQGCGRLYKLDVSVPDKIWSKIRPVGSEEGAGLLCGGCILERLESLVGYGAWRVVRFGRWCY